NGPWKNWFGPRGPSDCGLRYWPHCATPTNDSTSCSTIRGRPSRRSELHIDAVSETSCKCDDDVQRVGVRERHEIRWDGESDRSERQIQCCLEHETLVGSAARPRVRDSRAEAPWHNDAADHERDEQ